MKVINKFILLNFICFTIHFSQTVTTLANNISQVGIEALSIDKFGNLYTPSGQNGTVYKIEPDGNSSVFASGFNFPQGGTTDSEGNVYISNWNSGTISKISPNGVKSVFVGGFAGPTGLIFNKNGEEFYVCNYSTNSIIKINLNDNSRTTIASGSGINGPDGIVFDDNENLYIANFNDNKIHKINSGGELSLFTTLPGVNSGYITYANGNLYSAGHRSHKIYKISLEGEVSVIAGTGLIGSEDGDAGEASFNTPNGIVASLSGDSLFIADAGNRAIRIIDLNNLTTDVKLLNINIPPDFELQQNYPNPFNPSTSIKYQVDTGKNVLLKVYDVLGNEISTLVNEFQQAGNYEVDFNAANLTSGIYFYTLQAGKKLSSKKMMLLR